jgi:hypothetical protein
MNDAYLMFTMAATGLFLMSMGTVYIRWRMLGVPAFERGKVFAPTIKSEDCE